MLKSQIMNDHKDGYLYLLLAFAVSYRILHLY